MAEFILKVEIRYDFATREQKIQYSFTSPYICVV